MPSLNMDLFQHSDKQVEGDYGFDVHAGQPTASSTSSFKYFVFLQRFYFRLSICDVDIG